MSCITVKNIAANECGSNPGGLSTTILVARKSDILSIPEPDPDPDGGDGLTISGDIVFKSVGGVAKKWAEWEVETDMSELLSEVEGDRSQSVKVDLDCYMPGGNAETDAELSRAINGKFVVLAKDKKGNWRLLGNLDVPLKLQQSYKSGKAGKDANGFDLKFMATGLLGHPPYYLGAIAIQA